MLDLRAYEVALNSPTIWRAILLTVHGLSTLWFLVLYPKSIGAAERLKRVPAILVGVAAYIVYQGVFVIIKRRLDEKSSFSYIDYESRWEAIQRVPSRGNASFFDFGVFFYRGKKVAGPCRMIVVLPIIVSDRGFKDPRN